MVDEEYILSQAQNMSAILNSGQTEIGESWIACVTPNNKVIDGTEECSQNISILYANTEATINSINVTSPIMSRRVAITSL